MQVDRASKSLFVSALLPQLVYEPTFYEKPYNIRRQLFWADGEGRVFPRYPIVPETQREVLKQYVIVHGIRRDQMLGFWTEFVECLLACHNFDTDAPAEFRAWAYGILCRYLLIEEKRRRDELPYDPETNFLLPAATDRK